MENIVITPAGLLDILISIPELSEYAINITESIDGKLILTIGDSMYELSDDNMNEVSVPESVVDQIEDINQTAYEQLADDDMVTLEEPIESGIIKELIKTLFVGGMVRLAGNALKK